MTGERRSPVECSSEWVGCGLPVSHRAPPPTPPALSVKRPVGLAEKAFLSCLLKEESEN